jgi:hypothetical protein
MKLRYRAGSRLSLLAVVLLAGCAATAAAKRPADDAEGTCGLPKVAGVNQEPSDPNSYGKCTSAVDPEIAPNSNWCKFNNLGYCEFGRDASIEAAVVVHQETVR